MSPIQHTLIVHARAGSFTSGRRQGWKSILALLPSTPLAAVVEQERAEKVHVQVELVGNIRAQEQQGQASI